MEVTLAPVRKRLFALFIDSILIHVFVAILHFILHMGTFTLIPWENVNWSLIEYSGLTFVVALIYFTLTEATERGASPGKRLFNLRVIDKEGLSLTTSGALLRNASKLILGHYFILGFFTVFFTERKLAVHDMIAGSMVTEEALVAAEI